MKLRIDTRREASEKWGEREGGSLESSRGVVKEGWTRH